MSITTLPTLNATLNTVSAVLLTFGYLHIRRGNRETHQKLMIAALISSALFLTSYLIYHYFVGSVKYPHYDWTRPLYFSILIPHVILAALMTPFILVLVWHAWRQQFEKHRRLARWIFPVWMFVSVSGVIVYLMLYHYK
ncbi:MAG: DUF420 domain-containing protein [Gemmatimonadetes bacterium]|nr:MAG: DUF420 domain-containing protein [Gemmatimonadota bacterium]